MRLGPYNLRVLPKSRSDLTDGILEFEDQKEAHGHSHPEEEGRIILDLLSVLTGASWRPDGLRLNGVDVGIGTIRQSFALSTELPHTDLCTHVNRMLSLNEGELKQYVRASRTFQLALLAAREDVALSFLLLVTAIECLSGQDSFIPNSTLNKSSKSAERFIRFFKKFGACVDEQAVSDIEKDLKTIYYVHRSGFVHSGKEVSIAADVADRHGIQRLTHFVDGEEHTTPGLLWFANATQAALIGYLAAIPTTVQPSRSGVRKLAAARGVLTMRLANNNESTASSILTHNANTLD